MNKHYKNNFYEGKVDLEHNWENGILLDERAEENVFLFNFKTLMDVRIGRQS